MAEHDEQRANRNAGNVAGRNGRKSERAAEFRGYYYVTEVRVSGENGEESSGETTG